MVRRWPQMSAPRRPRDSGCYRREPAHEHDVGVRHARRRVVEAGIIVGAGRERRHDGLVIQSRQTVTRHGIGVARHYRRPPIGWRSRYLWSATATAAGFCRWLDSKRACSMSAEISAWRTWIVTHKSPRRRRSRYQRILRAPAETTGTLSEEMVMAVFRCRAGRTRRRPPPGRRHG
jgi:hypothetical protein